MDAEGDNDDDGESKQNYNSEEEEERAAKEAQKELMNGLKNISFADNVDIAEMFLSLLLLEVCIFINEFYTLSKCS